MTDVAVVVTPTTTFQTIDGFGTTTRLFDDPHVTNTNDVNGFSAVVVPAGERAAIRSALYRECGLSRMRYATDQGLQVTAGGAYNYAWKRCDGHIDEYKAVLPYCPDLKAWGAPIFPESWMSSTDITDYVPWALTLIRRWHTQGSALAYWTIYNEVSTLQGTGTRSPAFVRDSIKSIGATLASEGIPTELVMPDDVDSVRGLVVSNAVMADATAKALVKHVAVHIYENGYTDLANLKAAADANNNRLWMTEWFTNNWQTWANTMHTLLVTHNISAIDYLWGFFGDYEAAAQAMLIKIDTSGTTYVGYTKLRQYYVMGQYARHIRPGSVRVACSSNDAAVYASAFTKNGRVVVVLINSSGTSKTVTVNLGASGYIVRAYRTSASESWLPVAISNQSGATFDATIPGDTVTTFVGEGQPAASGFRL